MDNLTFVNGKNLVKQEKGQYMSSPVFYSTDQLLMDICTR